MIKKSITEVRGRDYYIQMGVGQISTETVFRVPGGSDFDIKSISQVQ